MAEYIAKLKGNPQAITDDPETWTFQKLRKVFDALPESFKTENPLVKNTPTVLRTWFSDYAHKFPGKASIAPTTKDVSNSSENAKPSSSAKTPVKAPAAPGPRVHSSGSGGIQSSTPLDSTPFGAQDAPTKGGGLQNSPPLRAQNPHTEHLSSSSSAPLPLGGLQNSPPQKATRSLNSAPGPPIGGGLKNSPQMKALDYPTSNPVPFQDSLEIQDYSLPPKLDRAEGKLMDSAHELPSNTNILSSFNNTDIVISDNLLGYGGPTISSFSKALPYPISTPLKSPYGYQVAMPTPTLYDSRTAPTLPPDEFAGGSAFKGKFDATSLYKKTTSMVLGRTYEKNTAPLAVAPVPSAPLPAAFTPLTATLAPQQAVKASHAIQPSIPSNSEPPNIPSSTEVGLKVQLQEALEALAETEELHLASEAQLQATRAALSHAEAAHRTLSTESEQEVQTLMATVASLKRELAAAHDEADRRSSEREKQAREQQALQQCLQEALEDLRGQEALVQELRTRLASQGKEVDTLTLALKGNQELVSMHASVIANLQKNKEALDSSLQTQSQKLELEQRARRMSRMTRLEQVQQATKQLEVISENAKERPVISGYLLKQGSKLIKRWNRRYVQLTTKRLAWWKDVAQMKDPKGVVQGSLDLLVIKSARKMMGESNKFSFEANGRVFIMQAPSEEECTEWLEGLRELLSPAEEDAVKEADSKALKKLESFGECFRGMHGRNPLKEEVDDAFGKEISAEVLDRYCSGLDGR